MKVYIGADHRGFDLKEKVISWIDEMETEFEDMGAFEKDMDDDYVVFAAAVGKEVSENPESRGILICGSGAGMSIAANKFEGARASIGKSAEQVGAARSDDDLNILVLAADYTSPEEAKAMITAFMKTKFDGEERHKDRLEDIEQIEENN